MSESQNKIPEIECNAGVVPGSTFCSNVPMILSGIAADWPIVKKGLESVGSVAEYLSEFYNGRPITYYYGEASTEGKVFYNGDFNGFNFTRSQANLIRVLNLLNEYKDSREAPLLYIGSTRVDEWLPGFRKNNDLYLGDINPLISIWLGNRSTIAAHFDCPNNIACNVVGKRTFTLFPPEQLENLYVGSLDITPSGRAISLVDLEKPDFEKFPKFREALESAVVVELDAGDGIYIPSMWWHHVKAHTSFNVLVNYWWMNSPAFMGNAENVLHHALLSLRGLPKHQREIWKRIFDFYIFDEPEKSIEHKPEAIRGILAPADEDVARKIKSYLLNNIKR